MTTSNALYELHEARLTRIEETMQDCSIQISNLALKQDFIVEKLTEQTGNIAKKIDSLAKEVQEKVQKQEERIVNIETDSKIRESKKSAFQKISIPLILTSLGFFISKIGQMVWDTFSK
jgi:hypothetical protein